MGGVAGRGRLVPGLNDAGCELSEGEVIAAATPRVLNRIYYGRMDVYRFFLFLTPEIRSKAHRYLQ